MVSCSSILYTYIQQSNKEKNASFVQWQMPQLILLDHYQHILYFLGTPKQCDYKITWSSCICIAFMVQGKVDNNLLSKWDIIKYYLNLQRNEMKYKNLHFELAQLATLLRPGKAAMVPHLFFLSAIFFLSFLSQMLSLCPVLLFQRHSVNTGSWIPIQWGEGQHSNSLPRHLICAWQPADRKEQ